MNTANSGLWLNTRTTILRELHCCARDYETYATSTYEYHHRALNRCLRIVQGLTFLPTEDIQSLCQILRSMQQALLIRAQESNDTESTPSTSPQPRDLSQFVRQQRTQGRPRYTIDHEVLQQILGKGHSYEKLAQELHISRSALIRLATAHGLSKYVAKLYLLRIFRTHNFFMTVVQIQ